MALAALVADHPGVGGPRSERTGSAMMSSNGLLVAYVAVVEIASLVVLVQRARN
jgi:hypothetical protein